MSEPAPASRYPGIKRAALEIAYDNGGIHRGRSEKRMLREFGHWLERQPSDLLPDIDKWLSALSEVDLQTVCAGEVSEADALLASSPPFTNPCLSGYHP